jgi:hypothetical protein
VLWSLQPIGRPAEKLRDLVCGGGAACGGAALLGRGAAGERSGAAGARRCWGAALLGRGAAGERRCWGALSSVAERRYGSGATALRVAALRANCT